MGPKPNPPPEMGEQNTVQLGISSPSLLSLGVTISAGTGLRGRGSSPTLLISNYALTFAEVHHPQLLFLTPFHCSILLVCT